MLFCSIGVRRAGVPSTCPSSKPLLLPSGQRPEGSHIGSQKGLLQHRSDKSLIRHREEGLRLRPAGGYTQLRIRKREIARAIPAVTQLPIATTTDVRLLLRPLAERELEFGSTPPDRVHLAEAVELTGSRPELPSQSRRADAIPPENSAVHTALWQLLRGARSSRLETVGA